MLVNESKYIWKKWQQPIFEDNSTWGEVSATSVHVVTGEDYSPFHCLDGNPDTHWESQDDETTAQFVWEFERPLKIYRIGMVNKPTGSTHITKEIEVYADREMKELMLSGEFPAESKGRCDMEPEQPFSCDCIILKLTADAAAESRDVGLSEIHIIAEVGEEKTVLTPFLNTIENMDFINNGYNDDGTYSTTGLDSFMFNGISANRLYISSNHWIGFGVNSEQLRICRRDGCSTAIYRQLGETENGLQFLKTRFEGYTVYNNRVESNRLIFELFLLSNNDMFLNVIQTPTSGNIGTSDMICNNTTTALTLADGNGGGTMVSFYHQDEEGRTWDVVYAMYETIDYFSFAYLMKAEDTWYTIMEDELAAVPIETLTAAMFLKYGCEVLPSKELLTPIANPHLYLWKAGGEQKLLKDSVKAYPYPHMITSVVDMSHISVLGIRMMTAQYSGDVGLCFSLDNGENFSEEMPLTDWLNTDLQELWDNLNEDKILILQFILHDNATITHFKITYQN